MDRRDFLKSVTAFGAFALLSEWETAFATGALDKRVGKKWKGWKKGHFQVHFIYTGVGESLFCILPDGTSLLIDCGDHNAVGRGPKAVPILPGPGRHAGEWVSRYIKRVNPSGKDVDYMMLTHYHNDHAGCQTFHAGEREFDGKPYFLSGFSQAAEFLNFDTAIDRCWPDYNDPLPLLEEPDEAYPHMKTFYDYMSKERGLKIEQFKLGALNQIRMKNNPGKYPEFFIRNICGNGRIWKEDGAVIDLYKDLIEKEHPRKVSENGMSTGMIIGYGPFRFFTAGDFSDKWAGPDGQTFRIEDALADICPEVDVAKVNHHGRNTMPEKLIAALRAKVWISCVWDQGHNVDKVMARLSDRSIYPEERVICPGIFPKERHKGANGAPWLEDIEKAAFEGGHIVLDVVPGGKSYSVTYLSAQDESMTVRSVLEFRTKDR